MRHFLLLALCIALPGCADSPHHARAAAQAAPGVRAAVVRTDTAVRVGAAIRSTPSDTEIPYVMVRDPQTGAVLPRLADTSGTVARRVNRRLAQVSAEQTCGAGPWEEGQDIEYHAHSRVDYAADSVFSVNLIASSWCGSPSPSYGVDLSMTFDLRTGKEVPFRALFAHWERDASALLRTFYPEYTEKARRIGETGIEPEGGWGECYSFYSEDSLRFWSLGYTFSDSGVVVIPDFPHVANSCEDEAVVPYERLRPFAAPGGILLRVADSRTEN